MKTKIDMRSYAKLPNIIIRLFVNEKALHKKCFFPLPGLTVVLFPLLLCVKSFLYPNLVTLFNFIDMAPVWS